MKKIKEVLQGDDIEAKKALFLFDKEDSVEIIRVKFNLWARYNFPQYFESKDAPFHKIIDTNNIKAYKGEVSSYVDIAFRGSAKTSRTKLFLAFAVLNDLDNYRKYIKVLSADLTNSKQIVTDVYNMLITCEYMYPNTFEKTNLKREETMGSFTTSSDVKVLAGTVGQDQRGALQNEARPDFIIFEDIETRKTLRSAVVTKAVWDNMEEARTSLAKGGSFIANCNYLSERGNVHKLVQKKSDSNVVTIIPIMENGLPTWDRYSLEDIEEMRKTDDDFEGERMCQPSASQDIIFDRDILNGMQAKEPVKSIGGLKLFYEYNPSHRYASGHDVAGGVGLDSSTSCFIDFDVVPARVVATYKDNTIKPDIFGYEVGRQSDVYGGSLTAIEQNNHGHTTIAIAKQNNVNLYFKEGKDTSIIDQLPKEYGWNTNSLTKPKMLYALKKAIEDGLLELTDIDLINEAKSYSRDDLMDKEVDPRLTTRHFDLLIACAIAWQMKDLAEYKKEINYDELEATILHKNIGI